MTENLSNRSKALNDETPITYKLAGWYGFILAGLFLLYGGVKLVLSFLDHNYDDMSQPVIFLFIGIGLLIPVLAYRELKKWGYWAMISINVLVVVLAVVDTSHYENVVLIVFSLAALSTLLAPATRQHLFRGR